MSIHIQLNAEAIKKAEEVLADFSDKVKVRAINNALQRTGQKTKTEVSRKVREIYTVPAGEVSKAVKVVRSGHGLVTIIVSGEARKLVKFKVNPSRVLKRRPKVQKAMVKKGGLKSVIGAFVAQAGGHTGVFMRGPSARHQKISKNDRTIWSQLPITELYGPSVPSMFNNEEARKEVERVASETFMQRIEHEANREWERLKK